MMRPMERGQASAQVLRAVAQRASVVRLGEKRNAAREVFVLHPRNADAIRYRTPAYTLKLSPQEQLALALGLVNLKPPATIADE